MEHKYRVLKDFGNYKKGMLVDSFDADVTEKNLSTLLKNGTLEIFVPKERGTNAGGNAVQK